MNEQQDHRRRDKPKDDSQSLWLTAGALFFASIMFLGVLQLFMPEPEAAVGVEDPSVAILSPLTGAKAQRDERIAQMRAEALEEDVALRKRFNRRKVRHSQRNGPTLSKDEQQEANDQRKKQLEEALANFGNGPHPEGSIQADMAEELKDLDSKSE